MPTTCTSRFHFPSWLQHHRSRRPAVSRRKKKKKKKGRAIGHTG